MYGSLLEYHSDWILNPIGPGRFFGARVPGGGGFFTPPLESDFSPKKGAIFGPEIKFGIIRALK